MTRSCKPVTAFLPGGFVRAGGKSGQQQLLKAFVKHFKSCVPDEWRVFNVTKPALNVTPSGAARFKKDPDAWYVMIEWWNGTREEFEDFMSLKRRSISAGRVDVHSDAEYCIIFVESDLDVKFDMTRKFPAPYLERAIRKA